MNVRELQVALGERAYPIRIGAGLLDGDESLAVLAQGRQVAIVSNETVAALYLAPLRRSLREAASIEEILVPDGEAHKNQASLDIVLDRLLARRFDRRCLLVALGGGVIGDLTGFAAAIYQRGVDFVQVPTTLLAQVDSSVGGKTAINHPRGKNMIGAFHQPKLVLADVETLRSLPPRELSAGLAEMIKHGAIADVDYLVSLERDMEALLRCEVEPMREAIGRSCEIKAGVVAQDERESGRRALLNFGHTFGHAIESGSGYGRWLHGEAVGTGMLMAADLSRRLSMLDAASCARLSEAVFAARLPMRAPRWSAGRWLELMSVDKKAEQGTPRFVLLEALGRAVVRRVPDDALAETFAAFGEGWGGDGDGDAEGQRTVTASPRSKR
ncbi:MAG: 3-dehydroquinate synthase [Burkholderiaceae bacterium]|nr:3-dehydroquinate synthase [Burkholderiaceae bacterium]